MGDEVQFDCRACKAPLVPPDPHRKYRTIKCNKCKEVTAIGPPPEDKKYVLCSCNALLILEEDASIFTCTRCKKTRMAIALNSPSRSLISSPSQRTFSQSNLALSRSVSSSGTLRQNLFRTVSMQQVDSNERHSVALEASTGPMTPRGYSSQGASEEEVEEARLNDDQQFILRFFASRVRPSVIKYIDGEKFWFMRAKVLIFLIYNLVICGLVTSDTLEHFFWEQFGFRDKYEDWFCIVVFGCFIASFTVTWIFNKLIIVLYTLALLWYGFLALLDPLKRPFFWSFYDTGHLMDEVIIRTYYLLVPRLQVPVYRFLNPPINSSFDTEFFYLSDFHMISLCFHHPKVHIFFKYLFVLFLVVKFLGIASLIAALVLIEKSNQYNIIYSVETFGSLLWAVFMWLSTGHFKK